MGEAVGIWVMDKARQLHHVYAVGFSVFWMDKEEKEEKGEDE